MLERAEADANHAGMGRWSPWPGGAASGAPPRFEDLYQQCFRYVWHVLRRLGVPPREREDVAQEVFLAVHRSLPTFDPARPVLPWVHGIAFHVTKNHQRQRRQEVLMDVNDLDRIDLGADPEQRTAASQAREIVIRLMQAIDLDRRAVLSMHDLDGMGMRDIARELGITLSAGYKRLETARDELQAAANRLTAQERHTMGFQGLAPISLTALLDADRFLPEVPAGASDRLWARLQGSLALGGAGATAAVPPAAPASIAARAAARVGPRVAPFLVGVAVGAGALLALRPRPPAAPTGAAAPIALAQEARDLPAPVTTAAPGGSGPPVEPAAKSFATPAASASSAPTAAPRSEDEGDLILQARVALGAGKLSAALAALDKHQRLYPTGRLAGSRDELRAQVIERRRAAGAADAPAPSPTVTAPPSNRLFGTEEDR